MYRVECFLPLADNEGNAFSKALFRSVREELVERFGGVTAHSRAPVRGWWLEDPQQDSVVKDDLLLLEVLADTLDADWWAAYRQGLEQRFRQDAILIHASAITRL
jgi:hypothetical protein